MGDLLAPVSASRKVKNKIERFETLSQSETADQPLVEVSTRKIDIVSHRHRKQCSTAFLEQTYLQDSSSGLNLADDAREILNSHPDQEVLLAVLRYYQFGIEGKHDFNVRVSGPKASQIVGSLVAVTIPEQWFSLSAEPSSDQGLETKQILISCLTSVTGIGALYAQIKKLVPLTASGQKPSPARLTLKDTISALGAVLQSSNFVGKILRDVQKLHPQSTTQRIIWQEFVSFVGGGKILAAVAQSFSSIDQGNGSVIPDTWLGHGYDYSAWLGKNISYAASKLAKNETESWSMLGKLLKRALSLGHIGMYCD